MFAIGYTTTRGVAERGGVQHGEPRFGRTKRPEALKAAIGSETGFTSQVYKDGNYETVLTRNQRLEMTAPCSIIYNMVGLN